MPNLYPIEPWKPYVASLFWASDYSNSMVGLCFLLYMVVVLTLQIPYLYRLYIFYHLSDFFVPNLCPTFTVRIGDCLIVWNTMIHTKSAINSSPCVMENPSWESIICAADAFLLFYRNDTVFPGFRQEPGSYSLY